ncbi:MAG: transporter substrate-binding domain-containing protein [Acetobacteraceae bacterium]|nr:transporter substrate-binding domain-containing protein [Acetobacteraceae bacterium]
MRRVFSAVLLALALIAPAAHAQVGTATTDEIIKRGKILVAIDTNNPPWGMLDTSMKPEGIDVDVANLLAKYMGVQLEIVPVTSQNRIPFIVTGKADLVMATLTITPERALQIWFSDPYAAQESIIMAPASTSITSFDDLKGKKVSVVRGAIQAPMVQKLAPGANLMQFDNDATTIQALMTKQVDATATGFLIPAQTNKLQPGANYEKKLSLGWQHIAIGLRRGNIDLLRWINTFIYHTRNNGELNAIFRKYSGVDLPTPMPTF